jgi:hypothetical protein
MNARNSMNFSALPNRHYRFTIKAGIKNEFIQEHYLTK